MTKKSRIEPLPYYKWQWRDWRANRKVQRMSWQAKGLYRELLDEFWAEGVLPTDHAELADICCCTVEEFDTFWLEIEPSWEVTDAGLVNRKMDEQRTDTDNVRAINARNGRNGALAKLANANEPLATASDRQNVSSGRHIAEQSREEQSRAEHTQRREEKNLSSSPTALTVIDKHPDLCIYEEYPRKQGKGAAMKAIQKAVARLVKGEHGESAMEPRQARILLFRAVQAFARSPAGAGEFVPHPATWFNDSRYLDDRNTWNSGGSNGKGKSSQTIDAGRDFLKGFADSLGLGEDGDSPTSPEVVTGGLRSLRGGSFALPLG